ncbi:MAG TPA: Mpo1-like protein [Terriglobia bacterium]|nr:Mpo1-like protein [Terriglobia bacterium]
MAHGALDSLWADYDAHHRSAGNKYCHMLGIPLIIVGLLGLLLALPHFDLGGLPIDLAILLVFGVGVIYVFLDAKLGAAMFAVDVVFYLIARQLNWKLALALFVLGWVLQFIGHGVYEKHAPAFSKNLAHLFVGPLWVLNHIVHLREEA